MTPVPLLLVHGVGHHDPGSLESAVSAAVANAGVQNVTIAEFNWDALLKQSSVRDRLFDYFDLAGLGRAFWTASWIGLDTAAIAPWRLRLLRGSWWLFSLLVASCALALLWWTLAYGAGRFTPEVPPLRIGLPWTSYWFPPVPSDVLARSLPAAQTALLAMSRAAAIIAVALTLLTWAASRLPLRVALRTSVFQLLWVPTFVAGVLPALIAGIGMAAFAVGFLSTALNLKFTIELADGTTWPVGPGFRELGTGIGVALALAALAMAVNWIVARGLKPIVDVVRYVGDHRMRAYVHAQLVERLAGYEGSPRIVVAAHSLGSVIVADSLLSGPDVWTRFDHVDFVTAGSPLHRLLARFFPSAYPPVRDIATTLQRSYAGLRWINVYRPTDYVGGALPAPCITNRCVWRTAWRTHSNYWADAQAIAWIAGQLAGPAPDALRSLDAGTDRVLPDRLDVERRLQPTPFTRAAIAWSVVPIGVVGAVAIVWSQFVWTPRTEQANLADWQRLVAADGAKVVARAARADAIDTATSEFDTRYEVVAFSYSVDRQIYGAESRVGWLPYAGPRFPHVDWDRLERDLDASGRDSLPLEVVYSASHPRVFVVPEYFRRPSYYGPGRIFFYTLRTAVLEVCWLFWCGALRLMLERLAPGEDTPTVARPRRLTAATG